MRNCGYKKGVLSRSAGSPAAFCGGVEVQKASVGCQTDWGRSIEIVLQTFKSRFPVMMMMMNEMCLAAQQKGVQVLAGFGRSDL
jgi:hypothetical protein